MELIGMEKREGLMDVHETWEWNRIEREEDWKVRGYSRMKSCEKWQRKKKSGSHWMAIQRLSPSTTDPHPLDSEVRETPSILSWTRIQRVGEERSCIPFEEAFERARDIRL